MREKVVVAGSGGIACGLAATVAAHHGDVLLLARTDEAAERARRGTSKLIDRMEIPHGALTIARGLEELSEATVAIEATVEDVDRKVSVLRDLAEVLPERAIMGTTTSSLSIAELAAASGRPNRFAGFHVFNPVPRMELVELVYPNGVDEDVRERMRALCRDLGKTCVEVPDTPGFVVNRLLFPYLFDAVRFMEQTGLAPEAIDRCMTLGTGQPMGPLALLDFVGLDVASAIGEEISAKVPESVTKLVAEGATGKKSGRGFYSY